MPGWPWFGARGYAGHGHSWGACGEGAGEAAHAHDWGGASCGAAGFPAVPVG